MRSRLVRLSAVAWLPALLLASTGARLAGEEAPDPAQLIKLLEAGDYDQREGAVKKLEALGEAARPALQKAFAESEVLEAREVAERLLEALKRATVVFEALDLNGRPLSGLEVEAQVNSMLPEQGPRHTSRHEPKTYVTDAEGRVVLKGFRPGPYSIYANWKERPLSLSGRTIHSVYLQRKENRVQYVLGAGGKVSGRVVSAATSKALANVQVALVQDRGQDIRGDLERDAGVRKGPAPTASTDAQGAFVMEKVQQGVYRVVVTHDDYAPEIGELVRVREGAAIELAAPVKLTARTTALGALKIRVLNPAGEPVKKAAVSVETSRIPAPEEWAEELQAWQRRLQQNRGGQNVAWPETDDQGVIELKDLQPGLYRVAVRAKDAAPLVFRDVQVAAGQCAALEARGAPPVGSVSGKVSLSAAGAAAGTQALALALDDPRTLALLHFARQGSGWFWMLRNQFRQDAPETAAAGQDGQYELKRLAPGRYVLLLSLPMNRIGIVHGIEVKEGRKTEAPDLVVPGADQAQPQVSFRGTVVSQDGKPLAQALVQAWCGWGGSGSSTGADGSFHVQVGRQEGFESFSALTVTLAGYRPKFMDLAKEKVDPDNLLIRLEPQAYGRLRVTAKDPAGRPLENVWITPLGTRSRQPDTSRTRGTNPNGEALLSGLAYGPRQFDVFLDGYFGPASLEAEVVANEERSVSVTMKPGLAVKGRVELPPGADARRALVYVRETSAAPYGELWRTCAVDAEGRFACTGLKAERVELFPQYPGWIEEETVSVEPAEGATPDVTLKMTRPGGVRFELGAEYRGANLRLVEPGTWDPLRPPKTPGRSAWLTADSRGRAEHVGLVPGAYHVLVRLPGGAKGPVRAGPEAPWVSSRQTGQKETEAEAVYPAVEAPSLPGGAEELEKTPAKTLALAPADGAARGRVALQLDENQARGLQWMGMNGSLTLTVLGERALATVSFGVPYELNPMQTPIVVGTPPEGWDAGAPGEFKVTGLPPGEYRLHLTFRSYSYAYRERRSAEPQEEEKPQLIRSFKVERGWTAELGEVKFELPKTALERAALDRRQQMLSNWGGEVGDDEPLDANAVPGRPPRR
jgi:protocatechuate 3,4-dioxygenase beta subunit